MRTASIPRSILKRRHFLCNDCSCEANKLDACAICPNGKWGQFFCEESFNPPPRTELNQVPINKMVKSIVSSTAIWASKGFKQADENTLQKRIKTCHGCEFWNPKGFRGTGRCMKCGCSTWAKLRMATEKCPIGKW